MSSQTCGPAASMVSATVPYSGSALDKRVWLDKRVCICISVKGCLLRRWAGFLITKVLCRRTGGGLPYGCAAGRRGGAASAARGGAALLGAFDHRCGDD